ncbi:MAG TPA: ABC transporter permease [Thermoanaerobaculia bacterium]|nr:ABC transporter permease [Thermoanaerobaculia bacterium]
METLRIASNALRAHKLRSFLTLLGVIIGVMTVITVVSIISGLNNYISEKVFSLNPDVYVVSQFGIITSREQFLEAVKRKKIDWNDFEMVRERCRTCESVGAGEDAEAPVKFGPKRLAEVQVRGTTANMAEINNLDLDTGRFFTDAEERHSTLMAVIGSDVREELFGKLDPIGRSIRVGNIRVVVIGLLVKQGSVLGQSQDSIVYLPLSTWQKEFGTRRGLNLFIRARGGVAGMDRSMDDVRVILRGRRHTAFRDDDPFAYVTAEALQMVWKSISAGLFSLMILISGISLVVGGIVITNIMLVSVVERTREIGVRRAMGATRGDIRRQFLTEATLLALGGGMLGVLLGIAIAWLISTLSPMPTLVRPELILAGLSIAAFTGITAGFMPAMRAARLPPVEALRYE